MLSEHVLVLNQNYEPLITCSLRRAIVLMFLGKASLVEPFDGFRIRSTSVSYKAPSIVRLDHYVRVPFKVVMLNRKNIIKRDNARCQYCSAINRPMTVDHIIPKLRGGDDRWENLVCACEKCNNKKGDRTPKAAGMQLRRLPQKPSHLAFLHQKINGKNQIWKKYLFLS